MASSFKASALIVNRGRYVRVPASVSSAQCRLGDDHHVHQDICSATYIAQFINYPYVDFRSGVQRHHNADTC
jgi:hypothetical protein